MSKKTKLSSDMYYYKTGGARPPGQRFVEFASKYAKELERSTGFLDEMIVADGSEEADRIHDEVRRTKDELLQNVKSTFAKPIQRRGATYQTSPKKKSKKSKAMSSRDCTDPNCTTCRPSTAEKQPKSFYTGCRVRVSDRGNGTVIDFGGAGPKGKIAVCLDRPHPEVGGAGLECYTGENYGIWADPSSLIYLKGDYGPSYEDFEGLPSHIGVVTIVEKNVGKVKFRSGRTGRPLFHPSFSAPMLVAWHHNSKYFGMVSEASYQYAKQQSGADQFSQCYQVPREILAFCRMRGNEAVEFWPNSTALVASPTFNFTPGDYLQLNQGDSLRIAGPQRHFRLAPGTALKFLNTLDSKRCQVEIVGGADPNVLGRHIAVDMRTLGRLEEGFIRAGVEVVIADNVKFRGRSLKGFKATVVLPTDQDGELGLQFEKDIRAGSLDGHGQDRHCLYILQSAVRKVE
jgi:hypothetical protein